MAERLGYGAELVDAVDVVPVVVRDDHSLYHADLRRQQLLAQVGTAVDQNVRAAAFDQNG